MAHRESAPYKPQDAGENSLMMQGLESHQYKGKKAGGGGFSCKKTTFKLHNGMNVDSWRMQDWDYKKPNLPTYARGLFTIKNGLGQPEIVVRGYDKFFNHGEVRRTEWLNVEKNTRGPYELSVKENGCIIFIAGLEDGNLLVCSKHSTGARDDTPTSHAQAGERWLTKHLASVGKSRADLARQLRAMNATAVAELCDDEFEEHVLEYTPEQSGLYLHGINLNLPDFVTYPGHLVDGFAEEWGFKKTMYVIEDDIRKVKTFLDGVAETGAYNGRYTEGFVIRCQARETQDSPWEDWFFKYKFEEPYLMYRQWRECTKAIIAGHPPKIRKQKKRTEEYLLYARQQLAKNPNLGRQYNQNHGIIKLREDFLREKGLTGADIIREDVGDREGETTITQNVVLAPIATIGCGKTTVALALKKLFDWGHFQNDNVVGPKNRAMRFAQSVSNELALHPVVIADRNNHQKRERDQLIRDISSIVPSATFVALHYDHEKHNPQRLEQIRQALRERVLERGDNHQTIQAGSKSQDEIVGIMDGFIQRFQPVDKDNHPDSGFDLVIDLDPTATSRDNLETVISQLDSNFPKLFGDMPTATDLDNAIEAAMSGYSVDVKHDLSGTFGQKQNGKPKGLGPKSQREQLAHRTNDAGTSSKAPKEPKLEFFAVRLPSLRVTSILDAIFRDKDVETAQLYRQLKQSRRVQAEFHVTLIHRASAAQNENYWNELSRMHHNVFHPQWDKAAQEGTTHALGEPELGKAQVLLERLVWDNRLMTFVVRLSGEGNMKFETVNKIAHVTVGTVNPNVKPKESNDLLARWLEVGSGGNTGIFEEKIEGNVVLEGSVRGVLQKFGR
jgi:tRNA ligase